MQPVPTPRHQFPPEIIRHAVWLYLRFTLSYRDVEELLAERGLDVSYETVRRWVKKFGRYMLGTCVDCDLGLRPLASDEMVVPIQGRHLYLWRAVDSEGERTATRTRRRARTEGTSAAARRRRASRPCGRQAP